MPFSKMQREFFDNANHRYNIKTGATRSGKTYMDYYVIPKRIRSRVGKDGLVVVLGVTKSTGDSRKYITTWDSCRRSRVSGSAGATYTRESCTTTRASRW